MTDRRSAARVIRTAGLLVAVALAIYAVASQWSEIRDALRTIGVVAPVISLVPALVGLAAGGLAWRVLLADVGADLSLRTTTHVFFVGQLGKYLPGGVWPVLAQMELGRAQGAGRRQVGAVAGVAMAVNVVTGLLVAIVCLPLTSSHALNRTWWLLLLLPIGIAVLHPRVLSAVIARALRLIGREPLPRPPTARGLLVAVAWSTVMWVAFGTHLYVLAHPLAESGHRLPLLATGGYALAWVVGFLVVIAPSGAGVREAMLVLALAPAMPAAAATAVALLSRAVMTIGDVVWAGIGLGARSPGKSELG